MATTPIKDEEDLIILSDDDIPTNNIQKISVEQKTEEKKEEELISFDSFDFWNNFSVNSSNTAEKVEVKETNNDFWLNLNLDAFEEKIEEKVNLEEVKIDKPKIIIPEINLDLTEKTEEKQTLEIPEPKEEKVNISSSVMNSAISSFSPNSNWTSSSSSTWTTWDDDMNAILEQTIAKLLARKAKINEIKTQTQTQISNLNTEIKTLQDKVKHLKDDVKENEEEIAKIDENTKVLEKMKV